jgi:hypothetical protein
MGTERQVRDDTAIAVREERNDLPPQSSVRQDTVQEHQGLTPANVVESDVTGGCSDL